jgi:starch phosphorylase
LQSRKAIEASPVLQRVIRGIGQGRFSHGDTQRYQGLIDRLWNHDHFMVAADFDAYVAAQAEVDAAWRDPVKWQTMAVLNTARMGFFSSDRTIRGYMVDIWGAESALG